MNQGRWLEEGAKACRFPAYTTRAPTNGSQATSPLNDVEIETSDMEGLEAIPSVVLFCIMFQYNYFWWVARRGSNVGQPSAALGLIGEGVW